MASNPFKEQIYKELSRVTHALSHPKRMELIDVLAQKAFSVDDLSREISMTVASTSQHLQVLKAARLVESSRKGNFILYSIADIHVLHLLHAIRELGFRKLAEIDRLLEDYDKDRGSLESITLKSLEERSAAGDVLLIDVRPESEYLAGHIPEAVSLPLDTLKQRLHELPADKTIVAYCRGPLCVMAAEATQILKSKKFKALRMEEGYTEWKLKQSA